jgi:hypothetical protein
MKEENNCCPYCDEECEEVGGQQLWPGREDLMKKRFLVCWNCSAHVGIDPNDRLRGYPAKQHIRELRSMILNAWFTVVNSNKWGSDEVEKFGELLEYEYSINIRKLGWLEEDELRTLLAILDHQLIPNTPEVDALFV